MDERFSSFLTTWDREYASAAERIPMFDHTRIPKWDMDSSIHMVRMLYHARGHFYRFLWHLGSIAPEKEYKEIILANIRDEFGIGADGVNRNSHEQLYWQFAETFGVSKNKLIRAEILGQTNNTPFVRQFNEGHIRWILETGWPSAWAAFCAYERLDNLDYKNLRGLFNRLIVYSEDRGGRKWSEHESKTALAFFDVHLEVEHYEAATPLLESIWRQDPRAVRAGFEFIGKLQLEMWQGIDEVISGKL